MLRVWIEFRAAMEAGVSGLAVTVPNAAFETTETGARAAVGPEAVTANRAKLAAAIETETVIATEMATAIETVTVIVTETETAIATETVIATVEIGKNGEARKPARPRETPNRRSAACWVRSVKQANSCWASWSE